MTTPILAPPDRTRRRVRVSAGRPAVRRSGPADDVPAAVVTDRCNFRCTYCSPASWGGKKDLLSAGEFVRIVVGVRAAWASSRVRLTGGEPLIRPDILEIARASPRCHGMRRVAITTNGCAWSSSRCRCARRASAAQPQSGHAVRGDLPRDLEAGRVRTAIVAASTPPRPPGSSRSSSTSW